MLEQRILIAIIKWDPYVHRAAHQFQKLIPHLTVSISSLSLAIQKWGHWVLYKWTIAVYDWLVFKSQQCIYFFTWSKVEFDYILFLSVFPSLPYVLDVMKSHACRAKTKKDSMLRSHTWRFLYGKTEGHPRWWRIWHTLKAISIIALGELKGSYNHGSIIYFPLCLMYGDLLENVVEVLRGQPAASLQDCVPEYN